MATIVKTPSGTWKAIIRKTGFLTTIKNFRLKKDADDWARRAEDEIVHPAWAIGTPHLREGDAALLGRSHADKTATDAKR